jgi:glycine cleavage system H lipoate-binding protein
VACPFLTEGRAQYCHAAPMRKLILDGPGVSGGGLCNSPQYQQCELVAEDSLRQDRCPHLEEVRVQYCGASPIPKLVPFSDAQLSSCSSGSYRYCDSYLAHAQPHGSNAPVNLFFTPNHFWLDIDESELCHIGVDRFLADAVGKVDDVVFATLQGVHCPALTLSVHGLEWPMCFPNPLTIQRVNHLVRREPGRLTADPYGVGWLFEGQELPAITRAGLLAGAKAAAWQTGERERLAHEIHEMHAPGCDGGMPANGVAQLLSRPHAVRLFQDFFGDSGWLVKQ